MKRSCIFSAYVIIISLIVSSCEKVPVANFNCDKTYGIAPLTVHFTSTSTGEISLYQWDFGDGNESTESDPSHTYINPGTFNAALTVAGSGGTDSKSQTITVSPPAPVARFSCDKSSGVAPLTVNFNSTSTGVITSYAWNFGDGSTSSETNPSHTYNSVGTYTVVLTVTGPGGSGTYNIDIKVIAGTNVTFHNPTFTPIYITINSVTKTISVGGSVTYDALTGSLVSFTAYTSGTTPSGTQVGLKINWSGTITLTGSNISHYLNVSKDYFFIFLTNNGTHVLEKLYVNYGLVSQTFDNIVLSNNSAKLSVGYYKAYTNSNVRMYWQGTINYTYWNQGTHFTLPWTDNQSANLTNNNKTENNGSDTTSDALLFTSGPR